MAPLFIICSFFWLAENVLTYVNFLTSKSQTSKHSFPRSRPSAFVTWRLHTWRSPVRKTPNLACIRRKRQEWNAQMAWHGTYGSSFRMLWRHSLGGFLEANTKKFVAPASCYPYRAQRPPQANGSPQMPIVLVMFWLQTSRGLILLCSWILLFVGEDDIPMFVCVGVTGVTVWRCFC